MLHLQALLFLILPLFGWTVLRTILGVRNIVFIFPFSFVLGLAVFLVLGYTFDFFFGIELGSLISFLLMLLFSLFLFFKYRKNIPKLENPFNGYEILRLILTFLFISFFTYLISEKWIILDFQSHNSNSNYFLRTDKFPQPIPNWPTIFLPYHYAFDLLSATIAKICNISVINSFHIIVVVSSITTFLSAFAIAYFFAGGLFPVSDRRRTLNNAFYGAVLFYFSGNLLWLDAVIRYFLKIFPVQQNWSFFKTMCALGMHGSIMNDMANSGIIFASTTIGIQLFLLLLFLYFCFLDYYSVKHLIFIFLVSTALFHTAEYILYLFLLVLILSPFMTFFFKDKSDLKSVFLKNGMCFFLIVSMILFNNFAYKFLNESYTYLPTYLELTLKPDFFSNLFSLEIFGRFGNVNEHKIISLFSWDFISEFGFQLIFSAFVLYWAIVNKLKGIHFIFPFLMISFLSPFVLYLRSSPAEVVRMFHPAFEILSMLFALWIMNLNLKPFLFVVILPSIAIFILSGLFSPAIYLDHPLIEYVDSSFGQFKKDRNINVFFRNVNSYFHELKSNLLISDADREISSYLSTHSMNNDYGISRHTFPFDNIGLPCYSINGASLIRKVTFIAVLSTLDPYLINELKIRWLYVDYKTVKFIDLNLLEEMIKNNFLREVLAVTNPLFLGVKFKLFEFTNLESYIKTYPRKTYWTFVRYLGNNILTLPDSSGKQGLYLFTSEMKATNFLKEKIRNDNEFKRSKPFIDALPEDFLKQQAQNYGLTLYYVN